MTTYLSGGWYRPGAKGGLRTEVVDGAMDAAGYLHRAGIGPALLSTLALKVRSMMTLIDPQMTGNGLGTRERDAVADRLFALTEQSPELHAFVNDCLEHVTNRQELMAFYLHLVHVTRMLELLGMAKNVLPPPPWRSAPAKAAKPAKAGKKAKRPSVRAKPSRRAKKPALKRKKGAAPARKKR